MQLDIFEHSRDVMLRNYVAQALEQHDATAARAACERLAQECPLDESLPASLALTGALEAGDRQGRGRRCRRPSGPRRFASSATRPPPLGWHGCGKTASSRIQASPIDGMSSRRYVQYQCA